MSDFVNDVLDALQAKEEVGLATMVDAGDGGTGLLGRKLIVRRDGPAQGGFGWEQLDERVEAECRQAMVEGVATTLIGCQLTGDEDAGLGPKPSAEVRVFIEVLRPSPTLLIVGAGHIAQPLSCMGKLLGFDVAVLDDRPSFANRERFPEAAQVIAGPVDEELARFPITASTCVVLVTRGHTQDEPALRQIIASKAAYIGMIGSRRRSGAVLQRLAEDGVPRQTLERVCSPIGLDIGAETPEEIAMSILAEVINVRRRGERHTSSMSARKEQRAHA